MIEDMSGRDQSPALALKILSELEAIRAKQILLWDKLKAELPARKGSS
jgi:hypothetical protein